MKLEYEFTYTAQTKTPISIGVGPYGERQVVEIAAGEATGDRISGLLTGGGNWVLRGTDGFTRVDIRYTLRTHDGAGIAIHALGVAEQADAQVAAFRGEGPATEYDDHYIRTAMFMECGDQRYAWVNQEIFVAETRVVPTPGVEVRVYRLPRGE